MTVGRRAALKLIGSVPVALGFTFERGEALAAAAKAEKAVKAAARGQAYAPKFFKPEEWQMVRVLVDMIIPRDERSGSATEAGVPEFMDYIMNDPTDTDILRERRQTAMRGGLAWINSLANRRFGKSFVDCTETERAQILDGIAYYKGDDEKEKQRKAKEVVGASNAPAAAAAQIGPETAQNEKAVTIGGADRRVRIEHGPAFFNSFRDLTASGFWTSKMGMDDLGYVGNRFVPDWKGAPPEVLARLGLPPQK